MIQKIRQRGFAKAKIYLDGLRGKNSITTTGDRGWWPIASGASSGTKTQWTTKKLADVYTKSGLIFACVRELSTSLSALPIEYGVIDEQETFMPVDTDMLGLFLKNPWYSYSQILELWIARLYLTGAQFTRKIPYENTKQIGALLPLPTSIVKMETQGIDILGYKIGDKDELIPPEEFIEHRFIMPGSIHGYVSPLQTVLSEYLIDEEREAITCELLRNKNLPGYFISPKNGSITQSQARQLKNSLDNATSGDSENRGKGAVIPADMNVTMGPSVEDINYSELNGLTESRICMAFGIPPILLGAKVGLEQATYSNYKTARKSFYEETLFPLARFIATGINRAICDYDSNQKFRFKTDNIAELQEDVTKISERAGGLYSNQIITRDEARIMVGLEPVGGDEGGFRQTAVPMGMPIPAENEKDGKSYKGKGKPTVPTPKPTRRPAIGTYPDALPLEITLRREFHQQMQKAVDMLRQTGTIDMSVIGVDLGDKITATLQQVSDERAMAMLHQIRDSAGLSLEPDDMMAAFDVVNPELEKVIKRHSALLSKETMKTTAKNLDDVQTALRKELMDAGIRGPNTIKALTEGVQRVFENASKSRAKAIAVTESSLAVHDAEIIAATSTGVVQGFVPVISVDACHLCQAYNEKNEPTGQSLYAYTSIEDAKEQVGQYSDRTLPPYHPNCQCTITTVFNTDTAPAKSKTKRPQLGRKIPSTPKKPEKPEQPLKSFVKEVVDKARSGQ